jgi:hypothetical protein
MGRAEVRFSFWIGYLRGEREGAQQTGSSDSTSIHS